MIFKVIPLAAAFLAITVGTARGTESPFISGNNLWDMCQPIGSASEDCRAYVAGVVDAILANNGTLQSWSVCIRKNVALGPLADVVWIYLFRHPEQRDLGAPRLIAYALHQAFPCAQ
jgi:hypothetical protein